MVVEDDPDIRDLLVFSLSMHGFEVVAAHTGRAAVALCAEHRPDLITIDLGLPDLDGIEVCRQIRQFSDAYIVMITARDQEIDRFMGLECGADDFVSKPFSPRELHARINAMFRRPRTRTSQLVSVPERGRSFEHGPLTVDLESRVALIHGDEVRLTKIEFDLLSTLISSPRRVWSREILLTTVWGDSWNNDHHVVEVHVGNLRRKLGAGRVDAPLIHTVRGVGYRMSPAV